MLFVVFLLLRRVWIFRAGHWRGVEQSTNTWAVSRRATPCYKPIRWIRRPSAEEVCHRRPSELAPNMYCAAGHFVLERDDIC